MKLGIHAPVSKGLVFAAELSKKLGCGTIQIFSRSPRQWGRNEFNLSEVQEFRKLLKKYRIFPLAVHMLYLPNLATNDKKLYKKSVGVLVDELKRCEILGAEFLIIHPGRYSMGNAKTGIKKLIKALNYGLNKVKNNVSILVENLAGGGTDICWRFEDIAMVIRAIKDKRRIGVCLDTCHLHAAGYNVSGAGFDRVMKNFDKIIGHKYLKFVHLNDSKGFCCGKVDRHTHIGKGTIGIEGFRTIMRHPVLKTVPAVIETPKETDRSDKINLKKLRGLAK